MARRATSPRTSAARAARNRGGGHMPARLEGGRIAFLATDGVEQAELTEPWKAVEAAGGRPELISLETGHIQGMQHDEKGDEFAVDRSLDDADASAYDGLVLPGGVANPDALRV